MNSTILSVAKNLIDPSFKVSIAESTYNTETNVWAVKYVVTNISDSSDSITSDTTKQITISSDKVDYVRQRISIILSNKSDALCGIDAIFGAQIDLSQDDDPFRTELRKYCLDSLKIMHDACEACINLMIDHGISDDSVWSTPLGDGAYDTIYRPYRDKLLSLESEIRVRENEINTVDAMQNELAREQGEVQSVLNMSNYLGSDLWLELISYRRESSYKNDNYTSDGLTIAIQSAVNDYLDEHALSLQSADSLTVTANGNRYSVAFTTADGQPKLIINEIE